MKQFDPNDIVVTFRGQLLTGYMSGTFLNAGRNEDSYEKTAGAGGDITRVRKNDRSGLVVLTLQAEAPSNKVLSDAYILDEKSGTGFGPILIENLNGDTLLTAAEAWVRKPADVEYSDGASGREWSIECAQLDMAVGGATL